MLMLSCVHDPCINCAATHYVENEPHNLAVDRYLFRSIRVLSADRKQNLISRVCQNYKRFIISWRLRRNMTIGKILTRRLIVKRKRWLRIGPIGKGHQIRFNSLELDKVETIFAQKKDNISQHPKQVIMPHPYLNLHILQTLKKIAIYQLIRA